MDWEVEPGGFPDDLGDHEPTVPVAFVSTQQSLQLDVTEVDDDRTPEGMVCMGTYFGQRLIARSVVPPETLAEIEGQRMFSAPVRLGLAAVEGEPGLQCRLFALLPASSLRREEESEEPWLASVPRFEDTLEEDADDDDDEDEEAIVPILLGHVVRFRGDRRHPEDLAAEAADVLRALLSDDRPLHEVVDRVLEDL